MEKESVIPSTLHYIYDLYKISRKYPPGWRNPRIVYGHFRQNEQGHLQKVFYHELLIQRFKRTVWQVILPGQTAGLIKKIPPRQDGLNECHIRFYSDGKIDCELELDRWNSKHLRYHRREGLQFLTNILESDIITISDDIKAQIKELFVPMRMEE